MKFLTSGMQNIKAYFNRITDHNFNISIFICFNPLRSQLPSSKNICWEDSYLYWRIYKLHTHVGLLSYIFSVMYISFRLALSTKLLSKITGLKKYHKKDCIWDILYSEWTARKMLRNYVTQQPLFDAGTKRVRQKLQTEN